LKPGISLVALRWTLDNYWKDQDLLYNYESNLTTGEEIEIDEEKELSIVVDGQRSETDL
jgi:hypothetical protein